MSGSFRDHSPFAQTLARLSATLKPQVLPQRKVRALTSDYYIAGQVAEAGKTYSISADDAAGLVATKRAELVE